MIYDALHSRPNTRTQFVLSFFCFYKITQYTRKLGDTIINSNLRQKGGHSIVGSNQ